MNCRWVESEKRYHFIWLWWAEPKMGVYLACSILWINNLCIGDVC
jgi:hypothetical protein